MKLQSYLPALLAILGCAEAGTIVRWYGCSGEYQQTQTTGDGCTNISGWKNTNLCGIYVPPPGSDRCEFYTTGCGVPWGDTYECSVQSGKCDATSWNAIESYRCYA